jgi:hypothetical protein
MITLQIIIWIFGVYGLSYILAQSEIGADWRKIFIFSKPNKIKNKINYASKCIICTSAYVSLLLSFAFSPTAIFAIPFVIQILFNMVFGVGVVKFLKQLELSQFE